MSKQLITITEVTHVARLATIPISETEKQSLTSAFNETLAVVAQLQQLDVTQTEPTHQVTGLENVLREDISQPELMLSQEDALANALHTHDGYFVVGRIIDQD